MPECLFDKRSKSHKNSSKCLRKVDTWWWSHYIKLKSGSDFLITIILIIQNGVKKTANPLRKLKLIAYKYLQPELQIPKRPKVVVVAYLPITTEKIRRRSKPLNIFIIYFIFVKYTWAGSCMDVLSIWNFRQEDVLDYNYILHFSKLDSIFPLSIQP